MKDVPWERVGCRLPVWNSTIVPSSDVRSSETNAQNAQSENFQKFTCSNFRGSHKERKGGLISTVCAGVIYYGISLYQTVNFLCYTNLRKSVNLSCKRWLPPTMSCWNDDEENLFNFIMLVQYTTSFPLKFANRLKWADTDHFWHHWRSKVSKNSSLPPHHWFSVSMCWGTFPLQVSSSYVEPPSVQFFFLSRVMA